ncbi:MAG: tetratricopeptide repeat protein [Bacteroidota bacterium]
MKLYFALGSFLIGGFILSLPAQISPFPEATSPRFDYPKLYQEAIELYDKGLYGAARQELDQFLLAEQEAGLRVGINNDLHTTARYYQAMSAYYLNQNDALELLDTFVKNYPENTHGVSALFYKGKYYFEKRDYENAIEALEQVESSVYGLDNETEDEHHFMLAFSYFSEEGNDLADKEQAVRYFEVLTNHDNPYQEDALYYKAIILYREGTNEELDLSEQLDAYERAKEAFQKLSNSRKYGPETRLYLANTLLKLGEYDQLFTLAERLIEDKSRAQNPQLYHLVANASYDRGEYPNTVKYFREFLKRNGKMSRIDFFRLGYSEYKEENYVKAIPALQRVLGEPDSLTRTSSYFLGFAYIETEDLEDAKVAFGKVIAKNDGYGRDGYGFPIQGDPVIQDAFYQYAKLAFATQDYDAAREALIEIEEYFPNAPYIDETRRLLGEVWVQNRNYLEAIKYFESIPLNSQRSRIIYQQALYQYGLELFERKSYQEAEFFLNKAITNNFDNERTLAARFWISEASFLQGKYAQATQRYKAYLDQPGARNNPYFSAAHYGLGWSNFKDKKYSTAFNYFEQFTRMGASRTPGRILADAYLRAGDCLFLLKKFDQAQAYYDKVSKGGNKLKEGAQYALYQTAESQYRQRKYRQSVTTFDQLIRQYPGASIRDNALDRISEIYITWLKEYRTGAQYANTLVKEYPNSALAPDAYARLALAAYNTNNTSAAIQYFKKILEDYGQDKKNSELALNNLANILPSNEFDRILRDYRRRNPQLNENLATLTFNTGMDRFFDGNYSSAINQFSDYIKNFRNGPDYYNALLHRARSYEAIRQTQKALGDYQRVFSGSKNDFTNTALLEAGEIYFTLDQYQKSMELFERLSVTAQVASNRAVALFGIAKNLQALQDYRQAQRILEQIASDPEIDVDFQLRAKVEIGEGLILQNRYGEATQILREVEQNYANEYAARSQFLLIQILFEQGNFQGVIDAGKHMRNNYPTFNRLKAEAFLIVAEANYQLGEIFQAKGVLESLIQEDRFPEIQREAQQRLQEIQAEENASDDPSLNGNP